MSSINPVFQPTGPSVLLASGTPAQVNPSPSNNLGDCFRVVNTASAAVAYLTWGRTSAGTSVAAASGGPNTMTLTPYESIYLCLPPDSWFNVSAAGTVEVTPGIGGAGG